VKADLQGGEGFFVGHGVGTSIVAATAALRAALQSRNAALTEERKRLMAEVAERLRPQSDTVLEAANRRVKADLQGGEGFFVGHGVGTSIVAATAALRAAVRAASPVPPRPSFRAGTPP
jgi:heme exporter protein D